MQEESSVFLPKIDPLPKTRSSSPYSMPPSHQPSQQPGSRQPSHPIPNDDSDTESEPDVNSIPPAQIPKSKPAPISRLPSPSPSPPTFAPPPPPPRATAEPGKKKRKSNAMDEEVEKERLSVLRAGGTVGAPVRKKARRGGKGF